MAKRRTLEDFIKEANAVHNNLYDYSKVQLRRMTDKVLIVDPEYGEFWQTPKLHLRGSGHPQRGFERMAEKRRGTFDNFVRKAREVHGDLYDYSQVEYVNADTKVTIIDPEFGPFEQIPYNHLIGHGSPKRYWARLAEDKRKTTEEFVAQAKSVHGDLYDYSQTEYVSAVEKVKIIDPEYGEFWQLPQVHLRGGGNPKRGHVRIAKSKLKDTDWFIEQATRVHGDRYDYTESEYISIKDDIKIICNKHGEFRQKPDGHIHSENGCPSCGTTVSRVQQTVIDMIDEDVLVNDRTVIAPHELDIYLPRRKLAIEVNVVYRHSALHKDRNYHVFKYEKLKEMGIQLVQFWDAQIKEKPELVNSMIQHLLGNSERIYARKTNVVELSPREYESFLEDNHIQGKVSSKIKLGLKLGQDLVAVMGFSKIKGVWHLQRYCNLAGTTVVGGPSKLLSKIYGRPVVSFSDTFYSDGGLYEALGFKRVGESQPRLHYTDGNKLLNRRNFQRPVMLKEHPELDPTLSEKEMAQQLGYYQVFGGKTIKWVLE